MVEIITRPEATSIAASKAAVLKIPGVAERLAEKLSLGKQGEKRTDDELFRETIGDTIHQMDATYSSAFIPRYFSWSTAEADAFFSHEGRKPFDAGIRFSEDPSGQYDQCVTIGRYLKAAYDDAKKRDPESTETDAAREQLIGFVFISMPFLFNKPSFDLEDKINGIDRSSPDGTPRPTHEVVLLIERGIDTVTADPEKRKAIEEEVNQVLDGGNLGAAYPYLKWHTVSDEAKRAIEAAWNERIGNQPFIKEKLGLIAATEQYRYDLGVTLDEFVGLLGFSSSSDITEQLLQHLRDTEKISAFAKGYAEVFEKTFDQTAVMTSWDVVQEVARKRRLAPTSTVSEAQMRFTKAKTLITNNFPFFDTDATYTSIQTADKFGAIGRAVKISYPTADGKSVEVVGVNPEGGSVLDSMGHEVGHVVHKRTLDAASESGGGSDGQSNEKLKTFDDVREDIQEEIAQLLQRQFRKYREASKQTDPAAEETYEFLNKRELAQIGLLQFSIRSAMQKQLQLTGEIDIEALIHLAKNTEETHAKEGINIPHPGILLSLFPDDVIDGTKYIVSGSADQDLEKAFETRFASEFWLQNPEAVTMLYSVMLATGKGLDLPDIIELVKHRSIEEAVAELSVYGVTPPKITLDGLPSAA